MPAIPIAESSAADRRRDQADEQRDRGRSPTAPRPSRPRTAASVTTASRKMIVSPASRMFERDLVRRLLALGALDERDHRGRGRSRPAPP